MSVVGSLLFILYAAIMIASMFVLAYLVDRWPFGTVMVVFVSLFIGLMFMEGASL